MMSVDFDLQKAKAMKGKVRLILVWCKDVPEYIDDYSTRGVYDHLVLYWDGSHAQIDVRGEKREERVFEYKSEDQFFFRPGKWLLEFEKWYSLACEASDDPLLDDLLSPIVGETESIDELA